MSWRKRAQEIAKRNPEALHPLLRHSQAAVFDAASAHAPGDGTAPERPILFIFRWLAAKGVVSSLGFKMLRSFEVESSRAELRPEYFTQKGATFLQLHYDDWYSTEGINYAIDSNLVFNEGSLAERWMKKKNGA